MDKINNEKVKKDVGKFSKWIFDRLTPNAARLCSLGIVLLVLGLGLCTQTGRNVISFVGYVFFGLAVLYYGMKFYKYSYTHANREPKPKVQTEPDSQPPEVELEFELQTQEPDSESQEVKTEPDSQSQEVKAEVTSEPVAFTPPKVIYGTISEWGKE